MEEIVKKEAGDPLAELFGGQDLEKREKFAEEYVALMAYYKCAMMEIETKFKVLDQEFSLTHDRNPISSIKSRLKSPKSIKEKLERKGLPVNRISIETNLNDVAGIRIVCPFIEDVYSLAEALVKQDDISCIGVKDYIKDPKENGYRSLHIIVAVPIFLSKEKRYMKVEVQLRTIAMNFWASTEHQLRYKKDVAYTEDVANELLECARLSAELDQRMNRLRLRMENDNNQ